MYTAYTLLLISPLLPVCLKRSLDLKERTVSTSPLRVQPLTKNESKTRTLAKYAASVKTLMPTCAKALDTS